jgi:hypothetical protein
MIRVTVTFMQGAVTGATIIRYSTIQVTIIYPESMEHDDYRQHKNTIRRYHTRKRKYAMSNAEQPVTADMINSVLTKT